MIIAIPGNRTLVSLHSRKPPVTRHEVMMSLPELLRHTRKSSGLSQLELALELGVSQRHVSFLECGKALPSRDLLLAWMAKVEASLSICNAALLRVGYSRTGAFRQGTDDPSRTKTPLRDLLTAHHPFPGLVFDADWITVDINRGGRWLCSVLLPEFMATIEANNKGVDMIAALAHPGGLLSRMRNPELAGYSLLRQLQVEQWVHPSLKPRVDALAEALANRFGPLPPDQASDRIEPHLNLVFDTPYGVLSFLTVQSVHGLPQDITVASLRTELWVPTDQFTRDVMAQQINRLVPRSGLMPVSRTGT
ncbi:helix-turn-helix domain-containing protein [Nitratireductor pacificus]|uniref:helix-turn-helix domain-containing protein n=1 Tax=Nitratireductor pacificus TaxID=1231180 RepID=UPI0006846210|nr:helix-turn-helix domain-containing protein [Nitratireductor pacificus]